MSPRIIEESATDLAAMEADIQNRLRRGKTRLLISNVLYFMLAVFVILFLI